MTTFKEKAARPGRVKAADANHYPTNPRPTNCICEAGAGKFADRLETACTLRKVGGTMARVALLMNATGCCRGTALRWLSGRTTPARGEQIVRIAGALDVDPSWLVGVANQSPLLAALTRKFLSLPPELQIEAVSLLDRLAINAEPARG